MSAPKSRCELAILRSVTMRQASSLGLSVTCGTSHAASDQSTAADDDIPARADELDAMGRGTLVYNSERLERVCTHVHRYRNRYTVTDTDTDTDCI